MSGEWILRVRIAIRPQSESDTISPHRSYRQRRKVGLDACRSTIAGVAESETLHPPHVD